MEARERRKIKDGAVYDHLFPKASVNDHTIMKNAVVNDTVSFIPKVVNDTLHQTKGIAPLLQGKTVYDTCRNIWNFVYSHIAYRKDKEGYEQIRSPSRSWHDRRLGVDCDCYTTFISSILTNLGIPHQLRITKYSRNYFQHIYPLAIHNGKEIIIDCVTDKFDYEVPYREKKDYSMDLQYLNGIEDTGNRYERLLNSMGNLEELGKIFKKKKAAAGGGGGTPPPKKKEKAKTKGKAKAAPPPGGKKKGVLKKVLNKVNKVNPATLALRNGVLAAMKLNTFNISKRMRWSYLSASQAKAKGINMDKWNKLVQARQKLENIFYGAGGNPDNLKNAMLKGKGNKDNAVHGLDGIGRFSDRNISAMNIHTPLSQLLGDELFYAENPMSTLGELGEPVTAASITAASGVLAAIASMIKKIGDIFGGKGKESKDFDEGAAENGEGGGDGNGGDSANESSNSFPAATARSSTSSSLPAANNRTSPASAADAYGGDSSGGNETATNTTLPAKKSTDSGGGDEEPGEIVRKDSTEKSGNDGNKPGMWEQNKKWIVPVGIGAGVLAAVAIGASMMKSHPKSPASVPVNGFPSKNKNHQRKKSNKKGKQKAIALL
jgi:hypothetical protein